MLGRVHPIRIPYTEHSSLIVAESKEEGRTIGEIFSKNQASSLLSTTLATLLIAYTLMPSRNDAQEVRDLFISIDNHPFCKTKG